MNTSQPTTDTTALLEDILNPSMTPIAICQHHALTLPELSEFLQGQLFTALTQATAALSSARTKLLALDITPKALAALLSTTESDEESRRLNETIRKSATKLLSITSTALHQPACVHASSATLETHDLQQQHPPETPPDSPPKAHPPVPPVSRPIPTPDRSQRPAPSPHNTTPAYPTPPAHQPAAALRAAAGAPRAYTPARNNRPP